MVPAFDIIAMGCVALDYYLLLDHPLGQQEKVRARSASLHPGGTMGNFASAAAKLGAKTGFLGIVGEDPWGDHLTAELRAHGVDPSRVMKRSEQRTPLTIVLLDNEGRRTNILPPFPALRLEEIDLEYIQNTRILHTHLFDLEVVNSCANEVRKRGVTVSVDLELHRAKGIPFPELKKMVSLCDLLFLNEEALGWLIPNLDIESAANSLREWGPRTVVVTLGDRGSLALTEQEAIRTNSFEVTAVDATGAGDAFAAAFCFGSLQGWSLKKTMEMASAVSALVVSHIGATTGLPNLNEAISFLEGSRPLEILSLKG
jgi:sugar/nucleoside kinase (ribokinase family)